MDAVTGYINLLIALIVYIIAEFVKYFVLQGTNGMKLLPPICGILGGFVSYILYLIDPTCINAVGTSNIVLSGVLSGMLATSLNQLLVQFGICIDIQTIVDGVATNKKTKADKLMAKQAKIEQGVTDLEQELALKQKELEAKNKKNEIEKQIDKIEEQIKNDDCVDTGSGATATSTTSNTVIDTPLYSGTGGTATIVDPDYIKAPIITVTGSAMEEEITSTEG